MRPFWWFYRTRAAETFSIYFGLQQCCPPITVWTDCQASIEAVVKGKSWATDGARLLAALWSDIGRLIDDIGLGPTGVSFRKTKAHATQADVNAGRSSWWQRKSNDMADKLAK